MENFIAIKNKLNIFYQKKYLLPTVVLIFSVLLFVFPLSKTFAFKENNNFRKGNNPTNIADASNAKSSFINQPTCRLENVGMSRMYGDSDSQIIGDSNSDEEDDDDFITFINYGGANVDISGWELYVDQRGTGTPVFTFPSGTILSPCEQVTVVSDWNGSAALPTNWFDANYASGEGMFEETSNRRAYAILRNPSTNNYISIHHNYSTPPTLGSGTLVCDYSFYPLITTDFEGCEMVYWDATANAYDVITDCSIYTSYTNCIIPIEICNNGIDDDLDGLVDCQDCDDCTSELNCADSDGDGIGDICDLDDDNDGIPDVDECEPNEIANVSGGTFGTGTGEFGPAFGAGESSYTLNNGGSMPGHYAIIKNTESVDFVVCCGNDVFNTVEDRTDPGNGYFAYFDMGVPDRGDPMYTETLNLTPNTVYQFSFWIAGPNNTTQGINATGILGISIDGTVLDNITVVDDTDWTFYSYNFSTGASSTVLFQLINNSTGGYHGADVAFDNLVVKLLFPDPDCDTDLDLIPNHLDLDSDNDGIFDLDEAGHSAVDANDDGIIDGAASTFGSNGLFDGLETSPDSDIINYTISDSEIVPNEIYDAYELDADYDGCFDAEEALVTDGDNDGIAGIGTPAVDTNGLVTSISYSTPSNNNWQDPTLIVCSCLFALGTDNDNDGVDDFCDEDDDNDGIPDIIESGFSSNCPVIGGTVFPAYDYSNCSSVSGGTLFSDIGTFEGADIDMFVSDIPGTSLYCGLGGGLGCNSGDVGFTLNNTDPGDQLNIYFYESGTSIPIAINWAVYMDDVDEVEGVSIETAQLLSYVLNSANNTTVTTLGGFTNFDSGDDSEDDILFFFKDIDSLTIEFTHENDSRSVCFTSASGYNPNNPNCNLVQIIGEDTDGDGIFNHLDLDSDNDGILDIDEAGHSVVDADNDGIIDGAASSFGTNGLFDAIETYTDSDTINYTISDSETSPDGNYDAYELDSDGDGCNDTDEAVVSDTDSDGLAGTGTPIVNADGLVTSIAYTSPANNFWQNPSIGSCLTEICDDGIDNDADGDDDCDDSDCTPTANDTVLTTCDNSNMTGSGIFFLYTSNSTVSLESGIVISYHSTLLNAQNGTADLVSPYVSVDDIIFARVERVSTGCYATSEITLDVGVKCVENCNNNIDDDGDGLIDCDDSDCPCCSSTSPTLNGLNKNTP